MSTNTEKISWDPTFSVGSKLMDRQHRQILEMINLLVEDRGASVGSERISGVLGRLTRYANEHFRSEERLLAANGYVHLDQHKEEHRAYRLKIIEFCGETMGRKNSVPADMLVFLKTWWTNHILESDMKYRSLMVERGQA